MQKTTGLISIFIICAFFGCNNKTEPSEQKNEKAIAKTGDSIFKDTLRNKGFPLDTDCTQFSASINKCIELLKNDNYEINHAETDDELEFKSYKNDFESDKVIIIRNYHFKAFWVKRKHKLDLNDNHWYPSFSVAEICFANAGVASQKHKEISEIIESRDLRNDKNYDYLLKNGNRLIYVSCRAKVFEEYAFYYKPKIEEIIAQTNTEPTN